MLGSQAVVDAERPENTRWTRGSTTWAGHGPDDARIVVDVGGDRVAGAAVGPGSGAGSEVCGEEGVHAAGGEVRDLRQADAAGVAVADLGGDGDEQLSLVNQAGQR